MSVCNIPHVTPSHKSLKINARPKYITKCVVMLINIRDVNVNWRMTIMIIFQLYNINIIFF